MNLISRAIGAFKNGLNFTQAILLTFYQTFGRGYETVVQKPCQLNGKSYPHGAEIMIGAQILECVDGEWGERVNPFITVGP
jgi:hypothetical protein